MIAIPQWIPMKGQRASSVLGLSLDGGRLEGVVLRRTNGSVQRLQQFSVALTLDPLTAAPELVGREIRNVLDAAGVRERRCVVGLPIKWVLTTHAEIPDLKGEDLTNFLQIEAERGFPSDVTTLFYASSLTKEEGGKEYALTAGVPRTHLEALERALRAAKLVPVSFALGISALQPPVASRGVLAVMIGESQVGLQIVTGGGVVSLRALEGALEAEGGRRVINTEVVARETRITLGQLPPALRETVHLARIFGPRDLAQHLADELELRLEPLRLKVEVVTQYRPGELPLSAESDLPVTPATSLAVAWLARQKPAFELLPPRVTAWQQAVRRYSSGKLRVAGAAAALVLVCVLAAFGVQQWQLNRLHSSWSAMAPKVKQLETLQQQIRQFRPWYDDSVRALVILRQLATAFPDDGVVSAKTVEIRDLSAVTCTGTAKDNQSLLKALEKLRTGGGVSDLKVSTIRGKSPMQFTFDFRWSEGGVQ